MTKTRRYRGLQKNWGIMTSWMVTRVSDFQRKSRIFERKQNSNVVNARVFLVPTFIAVIFTNYSFCTAQFCIATPHRNSRAVDNLFQPDRMINDQMMPAPLQPLWTTEVPSTRTPSVFIHTVTKMLTSSWFRIETCLTPVWRSGPWENFTCRLSVKWVSAPLCTCVFHLSCSLNWMMNIHGKWYKGHASTHDPQNCIFQFHINNTYIKYMGLFFDVWAT